MSKRISEVLDRAHKGGFKVQSNFARHYAREVAACCSLGMISTKLVSNTFGDTFYITKIGLESLNECFQHDRV